jgi:hypothetical protein
LEDNIIASFLLTIGLTMLAIGLYLGQAAQLTDLAKLATDVGLAGIP